MVVPPDAFELASDLWERPMRSSAKHSVQLVRTDVD